MQPKIAGYDGHFIDKGLQLSIPAYTKSQNQGFIFFKLLHQKTGIFPYTVEARLNGFGGLLERTTIDNKHHVTVRNC